LPAGIVPAAGDVDLSVRLGKIHLAFVVQHLVFSFFVVISMEFAAAF